MFVRHEQGLARLKQVLMRGDTVPMDEGEYLREMTLCLKNSIQQYGTFTMSEEKEWFDKLKEELTIFHTKTFEAKHDREPTLEELDQFFQVVMCDGPWGRLARASDNIDDKLT